MGTEIDSGMCDRLRAARERLGWSREELAVHSGVSWSAITQAESGRRRHLRPQTLSRLSGALGLSMDYLVNGGPSPPMLTHQALLYDDEEDFAEGAVRFLLEGLERSEPALALTERRKLTLLRSGSARLQAVWSSWTPAREYPPRGVPLEMFTAFMGKGLREGAV